jgi:hypothetical protein
MVVTEPVGEDSIPPGIPLFSLHPQPPPSIPSDPYAAMEDDDDYVAVDQPAVAQSSALYGIPKTQMTDDGPALA